MTDDKAKAELKRAVREYDEAKKHHVAALRAESRAHEAWNKASNLECDASIAEDKARNKFLRLARRTIEDEKAV